ncbi:MAG: mechanosensitive ion channel [Gemmatimonadota bacterium]|nr:mechanosensitive ion channel [Gemmatimonadota bacterium]
MSLATAQVVVNPVARDEEIRKRLQSVLDATGWFISPRVTVRDGVVFLDGTDSTEETKKWAGDLARNTQDVVAVVNRMSVPKQSIWDFNPASNGVRSLWRDFVRSLPFMAFGLLVLVISFAGALLTTRVAKTFFTSRISAPLLRRVLARALGVIVFLIGVYIILRVLGLTQLALTIVGGTGLIGLAVGLAFRDITENFLASIFLSIQRPFETSDLVEVAGVTGYVQQLNMRTTVLMTLDGNLVQIPNATVYKSNLRNYTTNCNRREQFEIGIGYDDVISDAQEIAREVLSAHPAVLKDPEPWVLVDRLGTSTVVLRVYFWLDGREHSWLKVRSSVIRLVKRAFQARGISMPDEAREIIFPRGVPVTLREPKGEETANNASRGATGVAAAAEKPDAVSTKAEAGLTSEAGVLEEQARNAKPDAGDNLLASSPNDGD